MVDPIRLADILGRGVEQPHSGEGKREAQETADDGEHHAFDEQLTHDAPAGGAERHAHRHLARARRRSRQQEVRHIGARDEQDERDGAHQRQEDQSNLTAVHAVVERHHSRRDVFVRRRVIVRQPGRDRREFRLCLRQRDAVGQPSEDLEVPGVAFLLRQARHLHERYPQVRVDREFEAFGHHADHGRWHVVHFDRAADDGWVAAIAVLPDTVAEDHHCGGAGTILLRAEVAAEQRLLADQPERVGRHIRTLESLGCASFIADVHRLAAVRGERRQRPVRGPIVLEVRIRHAPVPIAGVARADGHDAIGIVERQTTNEHGVDEREHRRVDADAERERDHGHPREPAILHEEAERKTQVLQPAHFLSLNR